MTDSLFQEPAAAGPPEPPRLRGRMKRRFGKGNVYTEVEMAGRHKAVEKQGRHCDANSGRCLQAATRALEVVELDSVTGEPHAERGEQRRVQVCSQHAPIYTRSSRFRVISEERISAS